MSAMVGKSVNRSSLPREFLPRLMLLTVFFLVGAVVGSFFAANISEDSRLYVEQYLSHEKEADIKMTLLRDAAFLALVFASAFFRPGIVVIPLCLGAKGFMLSTLVTYFIMTLGVKGYGAAFVMVFAYGFVTILCLFLVAAQAFSMILSRPPGWRGRIQADPAFYITAGIALTVTVIASVCHVYVTPVLSRAVSAFLPM